jgi:hypothetical protein
MKSLKAGKGYLVEPLQLGRLWASISAVLYGDSSRMKAVPTTACKMFLGLSCEPMGLQLCRTRWCTTGALTCVHGSTDCRFVHLFAFSSSRKHTEQSQKSKKHS